MRVAIYSRVSTDKQSVDMQIDLLKEYALRRNWEVVEVYQEKISGSGKKRRREFEKLMKGARERRFDIVLVYRFDRFSRSLKELIDSLEEFRALGIEFVSYNENIDTTTPTGKLMFQIFSAFAEFERNIIRERVMAGLERAKKKGKRLGRPRKKIDPEKVLKMKEEGKSLREIAKEFKVSHGTIRNIYKSVKKTPEKTGEKKS